MLISLMNQNPKPGLMIEKNKGCAQVESVIFEAEEKYKTGCLDISFGFYYVHV